jgi:AraC-like DNA-binding protein
MMLDDNINVKAFSVFNWHSMYRIIALYFLIAMYSMSGYAAKRESQESLYNVMSKRSCSELFDAGEHFIKDKNMPDSALLCLSLISNRRFFSQMDMPDMKICVRALNLLGGVYASYYNDYPKAYDYLLQAKELAQDIGYKSILPSIYCNFATFDLMKGSLYGKTGIIDNVLKEYKNGFHAAVENRNWVAMSQIAFVMGYAAKNYNKINVVANELSECANFNIKDTSNKFQRGNKYLCLALLSFNKRDYKAAFSYIDKSLEYVWEWENKKEVYESISFVKAQMLFETGKVDEGLLLMSQIEKATKENGLSQISTDVYKYLYDYFTKQKDSKQSLKYELLYLREKNDFLTRSNLDNLGERRFLFEINKMNEEAKIMSYKDKMKTYTTFGISLFSIGLLALLLLLFRKYRQVAQSNIILYKKNLALLEADKKRNTLVTPNLTTDKKETETKYKNSSLDEQSKSDLMQRIFSVMETSDKIYSDSFSLDVLAELVNATRNNVSQVINEEYKSNFNNMLNEYRIKEACRRINNMEYLNYTIEAIASNMGFKSRSYFVKTFKKFTGLTPSAYIKIAKNKSK